ncbi:MAG: DUF5666 domain-containing protein [Candidatus Electrothrix sp. Rat3]|nr:DUF5666 domain-containing protein [Candidatus Electrothrix rattekaaiensis]
MNTFIKSSRHVTSDKIKSGTLVTLAAMFISLFCASVALADRDRRYERYREEIKIYGIIDSLPRSGLIGRWVVGGREVEVTDRTEIEEEHGPAEVGRYVEVEGVRDNNVLLAYEIEVERNKKHGSRHR